MKALTLWQPGCASVLDATFAIAAWGGHESVTAERVEHAGELLRGREVLCLGRTKSGAPRHPSRLAYATPFETFWEAVR